MALLLPLALACAPQIVATHPWHLPFNLYESSLRFKGYVRVFVLLAWAGEIANLRC